MRTILRWLVAVLISVTGTFGLVAQELYFPGIMNTRQRNANSVLNLTPYIPYDRYSNLDSVMVDSVGFLVNPALKNLSDIEPGDSVVVPVINMSDSTVVRVYIGRYFKPLPGECTI